MKKLNHGVLNWNKAGSTRTPVNLASSGETYDYEAAISGISKNMKPRTRMLTNFGKQTARDDRILNTTDMFKNV